MQATDWKKTVSVLKASRWEMALEVLKTHQPCRASDFGWFRWGKPTPGCATGGSHQQNKYVRQATKLLREMEAKGLVFRIDQGSYQLWSVRSGV